MTISLHELQQARLDRIARNWALTPEIVVAWLIDELLNALDSGEDEFGSFQGLHALTKGMENDAREYEDLEESIS